MTRYYVLDVVIWQHGDVRKLSGIATRGVNMSDEGAVITSIETYALAVPLARPIADSTGVGGSIRSTRHPILLTRENALV